MTGPSEKGQATLEDAPRPPVDDQQMGCKRSRHNFNLFGFYNQADHIYQRRPNKVPSESVRPQNSLWQAVSQRLRQGQ